MSAMVGFSKPKTNYYIRHLAALRPTLGQCRGSILTNPVFITAFYFFRPKGHYEPRKKVGSHSPVERLVGLN